jgi:hypothetical protein
MMLNQATLLLVSSARQHSRGRRTSTVNHMQAPERAQYVRTPCNSIRFSPSAAARACMGCIHYVGMLRLRDTQPMFQCAADLPATGQQLLTASRLPRVSCEGCPASPLLQMVAVPCSMLLGLQPLFLNVPLCQLQLPTAALTYPCFTRHCLCLLLDLAPAAHR